MRHVGARLVRPMRWLGVGSRPFPPPPRRRSLIGHLELLGDAQAQLRAAFGLTRGAHSVFERSGSWRLRHFDLAQYMRLDAAALKASLVALALFGFVDARKWHRR